MAEYETIKTKANLKEIKSSYIINGIFSYLNKKRNGKGKEYYENGELKFEGEYLNGEKK